MKTILVTAYAVNPNKGSEDGMGWQMILQIARFQKVIAITRENNQVAIEEFMRSYPNEVYSNIQFAYFDLPYWMRFWKKGGRGALLYYYMWQAGIVYFIRRQDLAFDIAHNLNFHNDWTPSFLWRLGKPFVWGPVGHHPSIPMNFLRPYGLGVLVKDRLTWLAKCLFWTFDPFLTMTKRKATRIIAMNSSVAPLLDVPRSKIVLLPSVGTEENEATVSLSSKEKFSILSVGRFVPLKGFDVTIRSFAKFYHGLTELDKNKVELILVGKGVEQQRILRMMIENRVEEAIRIIPWIERSELMQIYRSASLFFFPSHEGAGMVVAEAMSHGVPVMCFDNCGPGEMVDEKSGIKIPYGEYEETIAAFADQINKLFHNQDRYLQLSIGAKECYQQKFKWEIKGQIFQKIYQKM